MSAPAMVRAEQIHAALIGYGEVPAVSTVATGEFRASVSPDEQFVEYELTYRGLQGEVRQAHIHFAQQAVNGPIVVWLCGTPTNPGPAGTPPCPPSTEEGVTVTGTITAVNVLPGQAGQQLAAGELDEVIAAMRAGAAYVNVHSDLSPGGDPRPDARLGPLSRPLRASPAARRPIRRRIGRFLFCLYFSALADFLGRRRRC
jgi:hypothetical protein